MVERPQTIFVFRESISSYTAGEGPESKPHCFKLNGYGSQKESGCLTKPNNRNENKECQFLDTFIHGNIKSPTVVESEV